MEKGTKEWKKWMFSFVLGIILICVYKLLDNFGEITQWISGFIKVLMPFFMALLLAYLFYLPCRKLELIFLKSKVLKKKARWLSIFTVYIIVLILIITIIKFVVPTVYESVTELAIALPGYYNTAIEEIKNLPEDSVINKESLTSILEGLNTINLEDYLNLEMLTEYAKGILNLATTIFDVFVTIIVSIY